MEEAPNEPYSVKVNNQEVVLDPSRMSCRDDTLSEYFQKEYGWMDYFGKQHEFALSSVRNREIDSEKLYNAKFTHYKSQGATDKAAEAAAKSDDEVTAAKRLIVDAQLTVGLLARHIKAWDKNHENVQSRGHFLRKEMDKLNKDILMPDDLDRILCDSESIRREMKKDGQ